MRSVSGVMISKPDWAERAAIARTTRDGRRAAGKPMHTTFAETQAKSVIYKLLANRTHLGELKHRTDWVKADHTVILSDCLFDQARAIIVTNCKKCARITRVPKPTSCSMD